MKKYKILGRNENCVLLQNVSDNTYKVRDIENDDICITQSYAKASGVFEEYDIEAVRKERKKVFEDYLKAFAEA